MSVVYASPNRSHHFRYAEGLEAEHLLTAFIQGYPRFKKTDLRVNRAHVRRRDHYQLLFIPLFRTLNEHRLTHWVNLKSKDHIDRGLMKAMSRAKVGLFYNGCGLHSIRHWKGSGKVFVCEAVNSHLDYQNELLRDESKRLGIAFKEPYPGEREKRLAEYQESDYILCPSSFVAQSFIDKGIEKQRLLINPFGIGTSGASSQGAIPVKQWSQGETFRVLYVGSISFRKGLRYLIEAFQRINYAKKELWIVGPNLDPDGIADLTIPDGIHFKGVLKGEALENAYKSSTVFVQPSIEEGLSLVIGEAMGFGLPVIATVNTGAEEMFNDGECGYLVPIRDASTLADRLNQCIEEPGAIHRFSESALQKSSQFGGWKASQEHLCEQMRNLL